MWLLHNDAKGTMFRVTPGDVHVVSRKDGSLLLLGDTSISRKHAEIRVEEENESAGITVKDCGSKYGTFSAISGGSMEQLTPNQTVTLRHGDSIKFGVQWNTWRVQFLPLIVSTSALTQDEKLEVKRVVESLGGRVVNDWDKDCTHLTMNKLTITVKVVCALTSCIPIVTPLFWTHMFNAISTKESKLPDCEEFLPQLAEPMLDPNKVSFASNPDRKTLLSGFTFVASSAKQLNRVKPMVINAGGNIVKFSSSVWTEDKLMEDKVILLLTSVRESQGSQQSQVYDGYMPFARKLRNKGIRCIPESDIGLSILYCSTSQFCNPRFSPQTLFGSEDASEATQQIPPTSEESMMSDLRNTTPIPDLDVVSTKKRPLECNNDIAGPSTKRRDLKGNSEDLFASQELNTTKSNDKRLSLRRSDSSSKFSQKPMKSNPGPSLDMFASSTDKSAPCKNQTPSIDIFNASAEKSGSSNNHNQSIDIFATNGEKGCLSTRQNLSVVNALSDNLFSSSKEKQNFSKRTKDDVNDEFSFPQKKKLKTNNVINNANKEDTTSLQKKSTVLEVEDDNEVSFDFVPTRKATKRNRASDPDMFASSADCSLNISVAGPSGQRGKVEIIKDNVEENLFAFPNNGKAKRRKINQSPLDLNKVGSDVKIAFLSTGRETDSRPVRLHNNDVDEGPSDPKTLVSYSKENTTIATIKKEDEDKDVSTITQELATVVTFCQSFIPPQKIPALQEPQTSVKNFKKFKKVQLNINIVPHIIGRSDVVTHKDVCKESSSLQLANGSNQSIADDDWSFAGPKKNTRRK